MCTRDLTWYTRSCPAFMLKDWKYCIRTKYLHPSLETSYYSYSNFHLNLEFLISTQVSRSGRTYLGTIHRVMEQENQYSRIYPNCITLCRKYKCALPTYFQNLVVFMPCHTSKVLRPCIGPTKY